MPRNKAGLNAKQERFVAEYIAEPNATQAAKRAGYSEKTAYSIGQRLLKHVEIAARIEAGQAKVIETATAKANITADRVLAELEMLAFSNVDDYVVDDAGNVHLAQGAPDKAKHAISKIKRKAWSDGSGDGHTVEVEYGFWNKIEALKLAGRYAGVPGFADKVELSTPTGPLDIQVFTGLAPEEE
jgi:phage terminase small subunit